MAGAGSVGLVAFEVSPDAARAELEAAAEAPAADAESPAGAGAEPDVSTEPEDDDDESRGAAAESEAAADPSTITAGGFSSILVAEVVHPLMAPQPASAPSAQAKRRAGRPTGFLDDRWGSRSGRKLMARLPRYRLTRVGSMDRSMS